MNNELSTLKISFTCPDCRAMIEEEVENAHYDWSAERSSDGIHAETTFINCHECGHEYEVEVIAKGAQKDVNIRWFPSIKPSFHDDTYDIDADIYDPGEYERFLADYEPANAFAEFILATSKLEDIRHGTKFYEGTENTVWRMIYQSYISALETYLSDTLIGIISNDKNKLICLIGAIGTLRDYPAKLIEVAKDESFALTKAKAFLQGFSFHNPPEVSKMYKAVLNLSLFESKEHEEKLIQIIKTRHHIVHRNGKDDRGNQIDIDESTIADLRMTVRNVVNAVSGAAEAYNVQRTKDWDTPF